VGAEVVGAEAADEEAEGDDGDVFITVSNAAEAELDYTENERCPPSEIS